MVLSRFTSERELSDALGFASDPRRPLEYTGYTFWSEAFKVSPINTVVNDVKYYRPFLCIGYGIIPYSYLWKIMFRILDRMPLDKTYIDYLYKVIALEILASS